MKCPLQESIRYRICTVIILVSNSDKLNQIPMHIDPLIYHPASAMAILIAAGSLLMIKEHHFDINNALSSLRIMPGSLVSPRKPLNQVFLGATPVHHSSQKFTLTVGSCGPWTAKNNFSTTKIFYESFYKQQKKYK